MAHGTGFIIYTRRTKLKHLARRSSEEKFTTSEGYRSKSWTHPTFSFPGLAQEAKKIKPSIHPASSFLLVTPGSKSCTHLLGR